MPNVTPNAATDDKLNAFMASHDSKRLIMNDNFDYVNLESRWAMNRELVEAVIERMGGEDSFLQTYNDIMDNDIDDLQGFSSDGDALKFFDENRDNLLDALKRQAERVGGSAAIELVAEWLDEDPLLDLDVIAAALYEPACDIEASSYGRVAVCITIARVLAGDTCNNFKVFIGDCY